MNNLIIINAVLHPLDASEFRLILRNSIKFGKKNKILNLVMPTNLDKNSANGL